MMKPDQAGRRVMTRKGEAPLAIGVRTPRAARLLRTLTCASALLLAPLSATSAAQVYHVRPPGGTYGRGDGSSWSDAYSGLPPALARGAIYYLADGSYPGRTFKAAESGGRFTAIKKATVEDHGSDDGWDDGLGDGEALFTGQLLFTTGHWVIDGRVRDPDWRSGYGIRIDSTAGKGIQLQDGGDYVTIRYVEIFGRGDDGAASPANDLIYVNAQADHLTIQYCSLHDAGRTQFLLREADDGLIEYCHVARNESTSAQHSEAVSAYFGTDRWTVRHNLWEDIEGTGIVVFSGQGWELYGNIAYTTGLPTYGGVGNGGFCTWTGYSVTDAKLYNNTFVEITGNAGMWFDPAFASGNVARNNMWFQCPTVSWGGLEHDYGWFFLSGYHSEPHIEYGTGDPFVDRNRHDFRLANDTDPGDGSLGPPYNVDLHGNIRGQDGIWDRGACERPLTPTATGSVHHR